MQTRGDEGVAFVSSRLPLEPRCKVWRQMAIQGGKVVFKCGSWATNYESLGALGTAE